jgi:repressor LexA
MRELTSRQREVLDFIRSFTARHGVPPTVREIGERFKVTPRAAFDHLKALERKGVLQRRESGRRTSRALTVRGGTFTEYQAVPILGRIAAGQPLLAEEQRDGELPVAASALPGNGTDVFGLRVRGDSMVDAHICDGDIVLVRKQAVAHPNDIVVAMIEAEGDVGEATVKRFQRDGQRVVLKPENRAMSPIVVDPEVRDVRILGKVIGVVRGLAC